MRPDFIITLGAVADIAAPYAPLIVAGAILVISLAGVVSLFLSANRIDAPGFSTDIDQ